MAELNCEACEELRQLDPNFVVNGFGDDECTSLQNDTGLVPTSGNNDFYDLNLMNDCLVGNMGTEVSSYDVCDWKAFMKKFIPNLWTTLKGIICAIGGIWTYIHKHECEINALLNGKTFTVGEQETEGGSYVAAGKGVTFLKSDGTQQQKADANLTYIAGGLVRGSVTLRWYTSDFSDAHACVNFDNGSVERTSTSRKGNSAWSSTGAIHGGELLVEFRINLTEYPMIQNFYAGFGQETGVGSYHVRTVIFHAGSYAYGQHGACSTSTGEPSYSGADSGHLVPDDYIYVQVRMTTLFETISNDHQMSPAWLMGVRLVPEEIEC